MIISAIQTHSTFIHSTDSQTLKPRFISPNFKVFYSRAQSTNAVALDLHRDNGKRPETSPGCSGCRSFAPISSRGSPGNDISHLVSSQDLEGYRTALHPYKSSPTPFNWKTKINQQVIHWVSEAVFPSPRGYNLWGRSVAWACKPFSYCEGLQWWTDSYSCLCT